LRYGFQKQSECDDQFTCVPLLEELQSLVNQWFEPYGSLWNHYSLFAIAEVSSELGTPFENACYRRLTSRGQPVVWLLLCNVGAIPNRSDRASSDGDASATRQ
jgi:hypothetical protein